MKNERSKAKESDPMNIQVVVFDFDGVFVSDSDAIFKKEAWDIALQRWAGRYETFLKEGNQLYGSGKSGGRVEIIRHVIKHLGEPVEMIPALVEEVAQVFDEHVQARILDAGLVRGAREMLETLSDRNLSLYLNSGTATSALQRTAQNLNIQHFFTEVLGSTKEPHGGSKVENLRYVGDREIVEASNVLFVGDGESDYQAAREFCCSFVGVANRWNQWAEMEKTFPLVTDLRDIPRFAEQKDEPSISNG